MDDFVADVLHWARATRAAHAGDAAASLYHFTKMHDGVVVRLSGAPPSAGAAQAPATARTQAWTEEMEQLAAESGLPWAQAVACFGRALLSESTERSAH